MKKYFLLYILLILALGCQKEKDNNTEGYIGQKPVVSSMHNSLGISAIRIHYNSGLISSIALINTFENDIVPYLFNIGTDSIVFNYDESGLKDAMGFIKSSRNRFFGYLEDSITIRQIYFEKDGHGKIIASIDSLRKMQRFEYRFDSFDRFLGLCGTLQDSICYSGKNVITFFSGNNKTENTDYDHSYNPYKLINDLLGFPFFYKPYQVSENNPTKMNYYDSSGKMSFLKIPVTYDSHQRIIGWGINEIITYVEDE